MLPTQSASRDAPAWWGTVVFLLVDASLYASLMFAYFYVWLQAPQWPPPGHAVPSLALPLVGLALLAAGTVCIRLAQRNLRRDAPAVAQVQTGIAAALMLGFLFMQACGLAGYERPQAHAYSSMIHVVVGYQGMHGLVAVCMAVFVWLRMRRGLLDSSRPRDLRVVSLFWHYSAALWIAGFVLVHLFPRWV